MFAFGSAFGFPRRRCFRNSIARGGSPFRESRVSGKLRRKRHNAVTPFATGFIAVGGSAAPLREWIDGAPV